jgi:Icc-related predicted phosphoesterase
VSSVTTRIFYATDIHGSETCFLKFINAAAFYKCRVLLMGGDITGKMLVPIIRVADGIYEASFMDRQWRVEGKTELMELEKKIRRSAAYPYIGSREEIDYLEHDEQAVSEVFTRVMVAETKRLVEIAEAKLAGKDILCYVTPGNDDEMALDEAFSGGEMVINPEGQVVSLDDDHEMLSSGYANMTPWACPRDEPEESLRKRIEAMAMRLSTPETAIFNLHGPPYASKLDEAPELDENLAPVLVGGQLHIIPVGSTAVRDAIEQWQPLVSLHGHIHESKGTSRIGRTQCFNPGSEYGAGYLRGLILELERHKVKSYQFTSG